MSGLTLGPFDLIGPAGAGAMGEVWRAVHRGQGVPVAIKLVTATAARAERYRALFGREVRAVARLDHPGIVRVYDHGVVPEALAARSHQRLPAGAPWLAMTWLGGGSLRARRGRMPWPALRQTLLSLLDALAHAHARGLVHRDFKDANVLVGQAGPVVTDFGLALEAEDVAGGAPQRVVGTPYFMAPEVVRGQGRALGPWTDLYAVGCLAFALVTGAPPFAGGTPVEVMHDQAGARRPRVRARHAVPADFEAWVHRLMAIDPRRRFRFAADAAFALQRLQAPAPTVDDDPAERTAPDDVLGGLEPTLIAPPVFVALGETAWTEAPPEAVRPPMPEDWRRPPGPPRPPPLSGVGQALVALREPRLRGRRAERQALWGALRRVIDGEGPRAVVLDGASGAGKTRLARWLLYRAHELGLAEGRVAHHAAAPEPGAGIGPMLARALRCRGLMGEAQVAQIRRVGGFAQDDRRPDRIAAALDEGDRLGGALSLGGEQARIAAWLAALAGLARDRAVIVLVDDAQWAEDAPGLVQAALDRCPAPVLFVLTVRDDVAAPGVAPRLAALRAHPRVEGLTVGPLSDRAVRRIIDDRLSLDRRTAEIVQRRAGGSPLFAAELVLHWVQCEALTAGEGGFRVRAGAREAMPDGLGALWRARIDRALAGAEPWAAEALEGAAVLGASPAPAEWRGVCAAAGLPVPEAAVDRLGRARLLVDEGDDGWRFAHAMVREALIDRARGGGRLRRWHHLAATALAALDGPGRDTRRAHHLQRAGLPAQALPLFTAAGWRAWRISEDRRARRLAVAAARAAWRAGVPRGAPARADLRALWSLCGRGSRNAARHARQADPAGAPPLVAARVGFARAYAETGGSDPAALAARFEEARAAAARAMEAAGAEDDGAWGEAAFLAVRSLRWRSVALARHGDGAGAERCLDAAEAIIAAAAARGAPLDPAEAAYTEARRAELAMLGGDRDAAWDRATAARARFSAIGHRAGLGMIARQLSEIARARGEQLAAERWLRAARRVWIELGRQQAVRLVDLNLGLALSEMGRFDEARSRLEGLRGPGCPAHYDVLACLLLLACDAHAEDWSAWDRHWDRIAPLRAGRLVEPDVAIAARLAARAAAVAGSEARADAAFRLALDQYRRLGRAAEVEALRAERSFTPTGPLGEG